MGTGSHQSAGVKLYISAMDLFKFLKAPPTFVLRGSGREDFNLSGEGFLYINDNHVATVRGGPSFMEKKHYLLDHLATPPELENLGLGKLVLLELGYRICEHLENVEQIIINLQAGNSGAKPSLTTARRAILNSIKAKNVDAVVIEAKTGNERTSGNWYRGDWPTVKDVEAKRASVLKNHPQLALPHAEFTKWKMTRK